MPIYEYECSACKHQLEAFQKMSDAALTDCPECHKSTLHKQVSAAGFQLKGTGWYASDFRGKGTSGGSKAGGDNKSNSGESKGGSDSGSTTSTSMDTKAK